jgi:GNAT superfamily N-acetyltransferase
VKRFLIINAKKLLEAIRKKREFYRPVGKVLRNLDVDDVVMRFPERSDIDLLESLLSHGDYTKHRRRIQDQEDGRISYVVAWAWGRIPVGHVLVHWDGGHDGPLSDLEGRGPLLEDLYVHPAVWGRGIGTMIMDEAEKLVESRGRDRVALTTFTLNPSVVFIYEARGYRRTDLGAFVIERVFTDRKGRQHNWSRRGYYMVKVFEEQEHGHQG